MLGVPWASASWGTCIFFWICLMVWAWDLCEDLNHWWSSKAHGLETGHRTTIWCGKGLPAMSTEKSHRTDPKALGPRVPTPCNTQWGSNCVQNWVVDIRITWILFWPRPTLISRLKFCSLWGAGSLTTAFEIGTFILFSTWDTLWHTDTHNWIMYQTLESRDRFCYLKPVWSSTDPWYSWSYSVPCSWGVQSGRSCMCPVDPVPWGWQTL